MAVMRTRLSRGLEVPWLAPCLIANLFRLLTEFEALFIPIASLVLLFRIPTGFRQRRNQDIEALRLGTFVIFLAIRLDGFGHSPAKTFFNLDRQAGDPHGPPAPPKSLTPRPRRTLIS